MQLEVAITAQYDEKYNCAKCLDLEKYGKKGIETMQERKHCFTRSEKPLDSSDEWEFHICLGRLYGQYEEDLIRDYQRLRDYHQLKYTGNIGDSPAWWVEAMDYIREECIAWERIIAEREKKKRELKKKIK